MTQGNVLQLTDSKFKEPLPMSKVTRVLIYALFIVPLFVFTSPSGVRSEEGSSPEFIMAAAGEFIAPNAPQGSYRLTCSNVKLDQDTLAGNCLSIKEAWVYTSLSIYGCVDDIANMDGRLSCSKGGVPPKGSYKQTCRLIEVQRVPGVPLTAECQAVDGHWIRTNHEGSCPAGQDLANLNGQLTCH